MHGREYRIGRFVLHPHRQLLEEGAPVAIGRKPLELLSVLAKAEGALVTKDELMAAVWPQAVVEENALQAHIAGLRKLLGPDGRLLSTARGLGYRLAAAPSGGLLDPEGALESGAPPGDLDSGVDARPARGRFTKRRISTLASVAGVIAAGLAPAFSGRLPWGSPPSDERLAVVPFETHGPTADVQGFSDGLLDKISDVLSARQASVVSQADSRRLRGPDMDAALHRLRVDLLLDGEVRSDGRTYDIRARLNDVPEHVILWSEEFRGPVSAPEPLQAAVAAHMADVAYWARKGRSGRVKLDAPALAAFIAGVESTTGVRDGADGVDLSDYRKVVAASPGFSWGHSSVAVASAFEALDDPDSADAPRLFADARREAKQALALEPHNGEAYLALELATPRTALRAREDLLLNGALADPSFEPTIMMEGRLLWSAGRARDALTWFERAHALNPLHSGTTFSLAIDLASTGHAAESRTLVAQMEAQWPELEVTRYARLWTSVAEHSTDEAIALLADPRARPADMSEAALAAWRRSLQAVRAKDAAAKSGAVRSILVAADAGGLSHGEATLLLAMAGDLDDAFAQARAFRWTDPGRPPYLFLPPAAPLRADPRFMRLAQGLGLVAYWRSTGRWPDFCSEPGLPYDCRAEAKKLSG